MTKLYCAIVSIGALLLLKVENPLTFVSLHGFCRIPNDENNDANPDGLKIYHCARSVSRPKGKAAALLVFRENRAKLPLTLRSC